jgi:hypothetical protein
MKFNWQKKYTLLSTGEIISDCLLEKSIMIKQSNYVLDLAYSKVDYVEINDILYAIENDTPDGALLWVTGFGWFSKVTGLQELPENSMTAKKRITALWKYNTAEHDKVMLVRYAL